MRKCVALTAVFLFAACTGSLEVDDGSGDPDNPDPGDPPPPGETELTFAGIDTGEWPGGDSLVATWSSGTGEGELGYMLYIETLDGTVVATEETVETTATVSGLPGGEYRMRVEATDELGRMDDGGRSVLQFVGENRLVFRSNIHLHGAADVWGHEDLVVIAGQGGFSFMLIDVSVPEEPVELARVEDEGYVKDAKISEDGTILYINGEGTGAGARIFDISDPRNPVRVSRISSPSSVHNLSYENGYLYLTDNGSGGVKIVDVEDPQNPDVVVNWSPPNSSVHDQVVLDGLMYVAHWSGFSQVDVSDPEQPETLFTHFYNDSTSATHNVWPSKDHRYALTTDETGGGYLRIFDIQDPDNIEQVATWWTDPGHIIHNVHTRGDYAFIAYYVDGVRVLDIRDPTNPVEVGWYDDQANGSGMSGTWGVWPYGNHVAMGSGTEGLVIFDFFPIVATAGSDAYPL